nr:transposase family protein [Longispora sp. (in: high G+C Gram-positive bacteria)]
MTSSSIAAAGSQYLLDLLAQIPDPRKKRGRRHSLAGLLAVGVAAVVAGSRSFAARGDPSCLYGQTANAHGFAHGNALDACDQRRYLRQLG